jgi:hypothetical protein
VFPHLDGPHCGQRIRDFRKAWRTACLVPLEAEKRLKLLKAAPSICAKAAAREVQVGPLKRQATGTANGTINRERSVLLKMLRRFSLLITRSRWR